MEIWGRHGETWRDRHRGVAEGERAQHEYEEGIGQYLVRISVRVRVRVRVMVRVRQRAAQTLG